MAAQTLLRSHGFVLAAFSPDGAHIVTASGDTAIIWDAASGGETAILTRHRDKVWSATFNSDGALIVTASADRTARTWDAATGKESAVLRGHDGDVNSAGGSTPTLTSGNSRAASEFGKPLILQQGRKSENIDGI